MAPLPHLTLPCSTLFGPLPEEAPSCDGRGTDLLPEDRLFSSEQDPSSRILSLLTYKMQWSNRHLPGFVELETVHVLESQNMVPGPLAAAAAAAAFKNVLEMQIIGLISDLLYQKLGVERGNLHVDKPSGFTFKFQNHWWAPLEYSRCLGKVVPFLKAR